MTYWILGAAIAGFLALLVACRKAGPVSNGSSGEPMAPQSRIDASVPFMEHPSDEHETAVDAMTDAIARLRKLQCWDRWITFSAQGQGDGPDGYHVAELKLLGDRIDAGKVVLDAERALRDAGLEKAGVEVARSPDGHIVLRRFSPRHVAVFMDALFRGQMGIRPHDGEGDDYAVGAEW